MIFKRLRNRLRCPHSSLTGIYGDEILQSGGLRLRCLCCGRLLDGPLALVDLRHGERIRARAMTAEVAGFCVDCPDHEACSQGAPCAMVKRVCG